MDPFIGQILHVGFRYAPVNWLLCNGATMQISQNNALFALLGNTFGGNGTSTFALPDAQGRAFVGTGQGPGLTPRLPGAKGGYEVRHLDEPPADADRFDGICGVILRQLHLDDVSADIVTTIPA